MDIRALPNPLYTTRGSLATVGRGGRWGGPVEPVEPVLQGELLRGGETTRKAPPREQYQHDQQGARRDDHPAFQPRYVNGDLQSRGALAAYAAHAGPATTSRPTVDFFV